MATALGRAPGTRMVGWVSWRQRRAGCCVFSRRTSVGFVFSRTVSASMTTLPMSVRPGRSYMVLSSTSSRIARRPCACPAQQGEVGDRLESVGVELGLDVLELEDLLVLAHEGVLRLRQDAHERFGVEAAHRPDHRHPADELRNHRTARSSGSTWANSLPPGSICDRDRTVPWKPTPLWPMRLSMSFSRPANAPTEHEQHVRRVDLDELLVRMLAPALRRNRGDGALEDLQQRLLHLPGRPG